MKHRVFFPIAAVAICLGGCRNVAAGPRPTPVDDLNPVTFHRAPRHAPVVLVRNGQAEAKVCVMIPPGRLLDTAVGYLVDFIKTATGATLEVVRPSGRGTAPTIEGPAIVIGDCPEARALGLDAAAMPVEGFAIHTAPDRVYIVGRRAADAPDGNAWGVIEFLERFVGVRWYYPAQPETGISIPRTPNLVIQPVYLSDQPHFPMRVIWPGVSDSWHGSGTQLTPLHTFLRAGNAHPQRIMVHSPRWQQVSEFKRERPEVYQRKADGTRDWNMICYGHPRTLETYLECIDRYMQAGAKEKARLRGAYIGINGNTVTVSPADAEVVCTCAYCRRLWDDKAGQWGSASKILTTFVAKLGRAVKQRWPQLTILYLPYLNYTLAPEGIELPDNVEVQICGMPGLAMYAQEPVRAAEQANIDAWVRLTGRKIQNWHYSCWPEDRTKVPFQYPHVVQRFYRDNRDKTVGTFINGSTDHWPRQNLTLYVWMKCLWNPDYNVDACIDTFCTRMFGPAAPAMRQLLAMQIDRWEHVPWPGGRISRKAAFDMSYPPAIAEKMAALLATARAQVKDSPEHAAHLAYYAPAIELYIKTSRQFAAGGAMTPLRMQKVGQLPRIDGKLDDACWARAQANTFVMAKPGQGEPQYKTTARGVWNAEAVVFGFYMAEPTPKRLELRNGGIDNPNMWWDDNVEIFIDPTGKSEGEYYQFIINPELGWFDAKLKDLSWNSKHIERAAHIGDDHWSLEIRIPYSEFPAGLRPGSGTNTRWTGNFTRHRVADRGLKPTAAPVPGSRREYQRMNTTGATFSNNMEDFAELIFQE